MRNNFLLDKYSNQLYTIPLPPDTIQISQDKAVGNLYGTGNHLDFVATIEIRTKLSENELINYYSNKTKRIESVEKLSLLGLNLYPDNPIDHIVQRIEVIPKSQSCLVSGSSKIFEKADKFDNTIDTDLFIVQIKDTHYGPDWDFRTH